MPKVSVHVCACNFRDFSDKRGGRKLENMKIIDLKFYFCSTCL